MVDRSFRLGDHGRYPAQAMRFRLKHLMIATAALALQMSQHELTIIGFTISGAVLVCTILGLGYYSITKFKSTNPIPYLLEQIMIYSMLNIAIMSAYLAIVRYV